MLNDTQRIIDALKNALPDIQVTRLWPKSAERLPCITVSEAANVHASYAGDNPYMERLEYEARVFSVNAGEKERLAGAADETMEALGYRRILCYDQDEFKTRMKMMRYRKYVAARCRRHRTNTERV